MNKLTRWYNQNKKIIWFAMLIIIAVISLIQILNNYYKSNSKEKSSSANNSTTTYNTPNYAVVSEEEISSTISESSQTIINSFFDYCNNGKIEEAYSLLSNDCKQELYPSLTDFKQKYYDRIFTETRKYNTTLWISNNEKKTYRLEIFGDILATGKKDEMPIEDYYTVIYEAGKANLSIGSYICKEDINIFKTQDNIEITVISKQVYMNYEKYFVKIKNNTNKNVVFNTKQNTSSLYIEDENELKYIAFLNEISEYDFNIKNGSTKELTIKFNREYRPNINIKKIVFGDIEIGKEGIYEIQIEM